MFSMLHAGHSHVFNVACNTESMGVARGRHSRDEAGGYSIQT